MEHFLNKWTTNFYADGKLMEFKKLETISEKISYITSYDARVKSQKHNLLHDLDVVLDSLLKSNSSQKCKAKSNLLKKEGIECYVNKRTSKALQIFSSALRYAPPGESTIPLLYGNRSAALFRLKMYAESIVDLKGAIELDCHEVKPKFLIRKIRCHIELRETSQATEDLEYLQKICDSEIIEKHGVDVACLKTQINEIPELEKVTLKADLPMLYQGKSSMLPQMSSTLELRENSKYGRHIVTKDSIKAGSVLLIEEPVATSLLPANFPTFCYYCFNYVINPITCEECVNVVWCGEKCRSEGNKMHFYECSLLPIYTSMGLAHLAVRAALQTGGDGRSSKADVGRFVHRCDEVESLLSHFEEATAEDQLQYCLMGYILATLQISNTDSGTADQTHLLKLASTLAEYIARLACNAHSITKVMAKTDTCSSLINFQNGVVGSALYPVASIFNHSCRPSVIQVFQGKTLIFLAKEDLEAGAQVYNCYGPCTSLMERDERRELLKKQYFFDCDCQACNNDTNILNEANWYGVKCPKCSGTARWTGEEFCSLECLSCNTLFDPSPARLIQNCVKVNTLYTDAMELLSRQKLIDGGSKLDEALSLGGNTFCERNIFLNEIRSTYVKILMLNGMFTSSLFEKCFDLTAERFGRYSLEFCNYLLGFLRIIKVAVNNPTFVAETKKVEKKMERILVVCYGSNWQALTNFSNCTCE